MHLAIFGCRLLFNNGATDADDIDFIRKDERLRLKLAQRLEAGSEQDNEPEFLRWIQSSSADSERPICALVPGAAGLRGVGANGQLGRHLRYRADECLVWYAVFRHCSLDCNGYVEKIKNGKDIRKLAECFL